MGRKSKRAERRSRRAEFYSWSPAEKSDSPYYFTTDRYRVVERDGVRTIEVVTPERLPTYPDCSGELGTIG